VPRGFQLETGYLRGITPFLISPPFPLRQTNPLFRHIPSVPSSTPHCIQITVVAVKSNRRPIAKATTMVPKPARKTPAAQPLKATRRRNANSLPAQPSTATSGKGGAGGKAAVRSSTIPRKSIGIKPTNRTPIKRKAEDSFTFADHESSEDESQIECSEDESVNCRKEKKIKREHVDSAMDHFMVFFPFLHSFR
jgi:hypothetical protein